MCQPCARPSHAAQCTCTVNVISLKAVSAPRPALRLRPVEPVSFGLIICKGICPNYYANPEKHTITITMDSRMAEYMKEHLPEEMKSKPPSTPYHPELMNLIIEAEDLLRPEEAKMAHRLCAQMLYTVVTVLPQWPVG